MMIRRSSTILLSAVVAPPAAAVLLLLVLFASHLPIVVVNAGANADCLSAPTWIGKSYKIKDGSYSDLNSCQLDELYDQGVNLQPNNNLLGGDGDASLFDDIYIGGTGDGCQSTENCMKDCQALCCIVPTCLFAVIHRDEDTYCPMGEGTCSIYKEDAYYWYCNLISAGTWKNTDDDAACYVESPNAKSSTCASVTQAGLGFNASTYQGLLFLGSNCNQTRRRQRNLEGNRNNPATDVGSTDVQGQDAPTRSLGAIGAKEIKAAVEGGVKKIRKMLLPGIQSAITADGGVKGFAEQIGKTAKAIAKGGKSPGKKGMGKKW